MAESCKRTLEITVPAADVEAETEKVLARLQKEVKLPGFRPGKVPLPMIRARFSADIRHQVLEGLVPKHLRKRVEQENLNLVGTPEVKDIELKQGEPLRFKAEVEVAPEIELQEYRGLTVTYAEPEVTDADVEQRLEELRDRSAQYVNVDPRPVVEGDYAVVALRSLSGVDGPPINQEELSLHVGDPETLPVFSEKLLGMTPGEEKEFEVTYPDNYAQERLSGKTVRFRMQLKVIRRKELPELNDEFARDLGDYQTLEELRAEVRRSLYREKEAAAQRQAKNQIIEKLIDMHPFPVPDAFVERHIESQAEQYLGTLAERGVDPRSVRLDWEQLKASQWERATREVKGSLIIDKIGDREAIEPTVDEVDREVHLIARQERQPVAAVRRRLEEQGVLRRIAARIRFEKTLTFLFDHARKEAPK